MKSILTNIILITIFICAIFILNNNSNSTTTTHLRTSTSSPSKKIQASTTELPIKKDMRTLKKQDLKPQQVTTMKIKFIFNNKEIIATLADTEAARDFASLLPLTLPLEDYAHTEKIAYLPRKLSTSHSPSCSNPSIGDIAYYAPWGNIAIFYKDFGYSEGLLILGQLEGDITQLVAPEIRSVKIELIK